MMKLFALITLLISLKGCAGLSTEAVPARLIAGDSASRERLEAHLAANLGQRSVVLASDVLVDKSVLILDPKPIKSLNTGSHLSGFETRSSRQFKLIKKGAECWLVSEQDEHIPLLNVTCIAAPR